jgi:osmoprotectant transport system ATP-binding protein
MPTIEFRNVSFSHSDGRHVLNGFSMSIERGEIVALAGRSGSGKTTVLKLINRLLVPDSGAVWVDGKDTASWDPIRLRRSVGYVIQEVGLFPHMTVADNVSVVPRLEGWPSDRIDARVHDLLALVDLDPSTYAERWPDELSGGQRQRVGVARALAVDPPVLLMDEPFGALDPVTRTELQVELRRIQARLHKTIIIVTHDMHEALTLGDRLGILHDGALVAYDAPATIVTSADPRVRSLLDATGPMRIGGHPREPSASTARDASLT